MVEDLINSIHALRLQIAEARKEAERLRAGTGAIEPSPTLCGRELSLVITKLEEAKMWAGRALGTAGCETPSDYPDDEPQE